MRQGQFLLALLLLLQGLEPNDLAAGLQFPHRFLQRSVRLRLAMQQPHFQNVVDARPQFGQIERLADEILGSRFERAQLVIRLRSDDEHRQVAVRFDFLQPSITWNPSITGICRSSRIRS